MIPEEKPGQQPDDGGRNKITDHEIEAIPEADKSEILERTMKDKEEGYQKT